MVIRINALPLEATPVASEKLAIDGSSTRSATIQSVVDAVSPVASEAEARAGVDNAKRMTPLRVKQSINEEVGVTLATADQGSLADTALQPADIPSIVAGVPYGLDSRAYAIADYHPFVAPTKILVSGYEVPGDGGRALYVEVVSEPSHAGKFPITLAEGATAWYEIVGNELPAERSARRLTIRTRRTEPTMRRSFRPRWTAFRRALLVLPQSAPAASAPERCRSLQTSS